MSMFAKGRSIGSRLVSGKALVSTGIGAGVGAGTAFLAQVLVEHTDFFAKYWYAPALGVGFLGHIAKSMNNANVSAGGMAMVGASGAMGYYSYKLHDASVKASGGTSGVQRDTGAPSLDGYIEALKALPDTSGVQDAPMARSANPLSAMRAAA